MKMTQPIRKAWFGRRQVSFGAWLGTPESWHDAVKG
jgi:hypothetical protein